MALGLDYGVESFAAILLIEDDLAEAARRSPQVVVRHGSYEHTSKQPRGSFDFRPIYSPPRVNSFRSTIADFQANVSR